METSTPSVWSFVRIILLILLVPSVGFIVWMAVRIGYELLEDHLFWRRVRERQHPSAPGRRDHVRRR